MPLLTETELLNRLIDSVFASSQKEVAKKLGISPQYLNDIIQGRRAMGEKVLKALKAKAVPPFYVVEDRKWTMVHTKLLKDVYAGVKFEDIE